MMRERATLAARYQKTWAATIVLLVNLGIIRREVTFQKLHSTPKSSSQIASLSQLLRDNEDNVTSPVVLKAQTVRSHAASFQLHKLEFYSSALLLLRSGSVVTTQKHFRCTMVGPDSSYSCLEIHICWKVLSEDRMEPPIQTEYFLSGGATTLIFIVDGARAVSSLVIRSPMPWNIVVPPERTTFAYRSLRMSTSHFMIDWKVVSCTPLASFPTKLGWKSTSGQRKRSLPTVMMFPSGSSYVFSLSDDSVAAFISVSKSKAM